MGNPVNVNGRKGNGKVEWVVLDTSRWAERRGFLCIVSVLTMGSVMVMVSSCCLCICHDRVNSCLCVRAFLITLEPLNVHGLEFGFTQWSGQVNDMNMPLHPWESYPMRFNSWSHQTRIPQVNTIPIFLTRLSHTIWISNELEYRKLDSHEPLYATLSFEENVINARNKSNHPHTTPESPKWKARVAASRKGLEPWDWNEK